MSCPALPDPGIPVAIFAKPPIPGRVKTRLAGVVGPERAAALAAAFAHDAVSLVRAAGLRPVLATLPGPWGEALPADVEVLFQGDGDFGDRIERVLRGLLATAPGALAVAPDSPDLPLGHLRRAAEALLDHDAVIGPAEDGGFWVLGVCRCPPGLLAGLPWSLPTTGAATLARLRQHGLDVAVIDPWYDVDEPADLVRLRASDGVGPATAVLLAAFSS